MKFLKCSILSLTTLCLLFACNRQLDLAPQNTLVESEVFKNEGSTEEALAGAYFDFFQAVTSGGGIAYAIADFTTPNLKHSIFYSNYDNGTISPSDANVQSIWAAYYKAINDANNLIVKIPQLGSFNVQKEKQIIAEAKFIRAYCYLDLLKLFGEGALTGDMQGMGVPLQLTPFEGYETGDVIPRSSNEDVYNQIIKDLQDAITDLPINYSDELSTRSRATQGAANALLARTYLYMQQYADAATTAQKVLQETSVYSLTTNLLQLFPSNPGGNKEAMTTEYIFGFPVSFMVGNTTPVSNELGYSYYYKRDYWINPDFINQFENGDLRVSELMFRGDTIYNTDALNYLTTLKFNNNEGRDNVPAIRLAEIMLIRAEALARTQSVNQESIDLLNKIRDRSVPTAVDYTFNDFPTQDDLIDSILLQRRFELAFEGFYRYDLIRTGQSLNNPALSKEKLVLPIPQIEVDVSNGIIKQNPGY